MATYNDLLDAGWRMQDIDGMDIMGFWSVRAWNLNADEQKQPDGKTYIDDIWA